MAMYWEGGSLRAIGQVCGVSAQAVSVWVKKGGAPRCPGCGGGADSVALRCRHSAGGGDCL